MALIADGDGAAAQVRAANVHGGVCESGAAEAQPPAPQERGERAELGLHHALAEGRAHRGPDAAWRGGVRAVPDEDDDIYAQGVGRAYDGADVAGVLDVLEHDRAARARSSGMLGRDTLNTGPGLFLTGEA